tara:strand:+ start:3284 stop:4021 length:738 start_codon:yes stop_codon:yes gene_type:complete
MSFIAVGIGAGGAALGAAGSIAGSVIQSNAAKDAAQTQAEATDRANQRQYEMYQEQRADFSPYRQAGGRALSMMENPDFQRDFSQSDFETDPGYEFRMAEAQKALERSAAARGGLMGGRMAKDLTRFSQGFASNEYQNAYNRFNADRDRRWGRLNALAGMGQASAAGTAAAAQNYGNMGATLDVARGASLADGMVAQGNAIQGGIAGASKGVMDGANWMAKWKMAQGNSNPSMAGGAYGNFGAYA